MVKELTTQQLADFLEVTRQGLNKMINSNNLNSRLLEKNCRLVKSEKQGRKIIYFIEEIKIVPKDDIEEYVSNEFPRERKRGQFIDFSALRLDQEKNTFISEIAKTVKITKNTGYRWEDLMIEKGYIMKSLSKDNDNYWVIIDGKVYPATKEDYEEYQKTRKKTIAAAEISPDIRMITQGDIKEIKRLVDSQLNCYYFKTKGILINNLLPETEEFLSKLNKVRDNIKKKYNL